MSTDHICAAVVSNAKWSPRPSGSTDRPKISPPPSPAETENIIDPSVEKTISLTPPLWAVSASPIGSRVRRSKSWMLPSTRPTAKVDASGESATVNAASTGIGAPWRVIGDVASRLRDSSRAARALTSGGSERAALSKATFRASNGSESAVASAWAPRATPNRSSAVRSFWRASSRAPNATTDAVKAATASSVRAATPTMRARRVARCRACSVSRASSRAR